jgi:hypothetical protein
LPTTAKLGPLSATGFGVVVAGTAVVVGGAEVVVGGAEVVVGTELVGDVDGT